MDSEEYSFRGGGGIATLAGLFFVFGSIHSVWTAPTLSGLLFAKALLPFVLGFFLLRFGVDFLFMPMLASKTVFVGPGLSPEVVICLNQPIKRGWIIVSLFDFEQQKRCNVTSWKVFSNVVETAVIPERGRPAFNLFRIPRSHRDSDNLVVKSRVLLGPQKKEDYWIRFQVIGFEAK